MSSRFSKISSYLETADYYLEFYLKELNFSNPSCCQWRQLNKMNEGSKIKKHQAACCLVFECREPLFNQNSGLNLD